VRWLVLFIADCAMIISCPACGTRYVVPETAIGGDGRTVRCAKCKHSWFQEPDLLDLTEQVQSVRAEEPPEPTPAPPAPPPPVPEPESEPTPEPETDFAEPEEPVDDSASGPSISHWRTDDHPATEETSAFSAGGIAARALKQGKRRKKVKTRVDEPDVEDQVESAVDTHDPLDESLGPDPLAGEGVEDSFDEERDYDFDAAYDNGYDESEGSRFDYSPPFSGRRNPLKMWTLAACIFALLATGTVFAVNYYGLPNWFPVNQPTFGIGQEDLELDFPRNQQRKAELETGEEIFEVRGSIRNTGQESTSVPSLLIVFRDEREKNVYSSVIVPSKSELAPGESLNVTEAVTNIPASAKAAEIGWSPG